MRRVDEREQGGDELEAKGEEWLFLEEKPCEEPRIALWTDAVDVYCEKTSPMADIAAFDVLGVFIFNKYL